MFILASISVIVLYFTLNEIYKKNPMEALELADNKFEMYSYGVGDSEPIISIVLDDKEDENELKKFLKKNIKKSGLNNYSVEIYKRSYEEEMELYYSNAPPKSQPVFHGKL